MAGIIALAIFLAALHLGEAKRDIERQEQQQVIERTNTSG